MSGVRIHAYWASNWVFDVLMYIPPITLLVLALLASPYEVDVLIGEQSIGVFLLILFLFATASPSFHYVVSHLFSTQQSALTASLVCNIIVSSVLFILTFVLDIVPLETARY
jgi:hypothetical protein